MNYPTFEKAFEKALKKCKEIYESHNKDRGDSWRDEPESFLLMRLKQEIIEYTEIYPCAEEAADIVNFGLMLVEFNLGKES